MAMKEKIENIKVGSLVRYSPYSTITVRDEKHNRALGLVISPPQFFGFKEKVQVQWFTPSNLKTWPNIEDLELVSESR
tara:strand:+ start:190 stop:423 length:234 start_codon:yes stop_codon:yes gene_type:complete